MDKLEELRQYVAGYSTAPSLETMPRRTLADKGIAGPTSAHVIEEVHTPFNLAFITTTTGTMAFQNIVGVVEEEIPGRTAATKKAFELAGVGEGSRILFTYPPLVNVFTKQALEACGVRWSFLPASSRDALLLCLCDEKPDVVIGESSFLRATLAAAKQAGLDDLLPRGMVLLAAGTPLDLELPPLAKELAGAAVHDLYGCQEFGWLTLDGIPLREDITLLPDPAQPVAHLLVGGLPTGDCFPVDEKGHLCNPKGKIITYSRRRTDAEPEVTLLQTPAVAEDTARRLAKTILRIKAKVLRLAPGLEVGAPETVIEATLPGMAEPLRLSGEATQMADCLLQAQQAYQARAKTDPTWIKER